MGAPPPDQRTVLRRRPILPFATTLLVTSAGLTKVWEEIGEDSLGHAPDDSVFQMIRVDRTINALKRQMD